jgi:riboflavin synthase
VGGRLGGHVVQGHVDGVGVISEVRPEGVGQVITVVPPSELMRYIVAKGSIAVDGVSLTVADTAADSFSIALIPETVSKTIFRTAEPGTKVNLEVDVIAKYVEGLLVK